MKKKNEFRNDDFSLDTHGGHVFDIEINEVIDPEEDDQIMGNLNVSVENKKGQSFDLTHLFDVSINPDGGEVEFEVEGYGLENLIDELVRIRDNTDDYLEWIDEKWVENGG